MPKGALAVFPPPFFAFTSRFLNLNSYFHSMLLSPEVRSQLDELNRRAGYLWRFL
jgi:hypothetical protein